MINIVFLLVKFQLYFILVFVMVLLSIFVLALSTEPSMRRRVSKCELLEYMKNTGHKHYEKVRSVLSIVLTRHFPASAGEYAS